MDAYYDYEDKWLRRLLAFFIIPGKSNTIKNILKLALKNYLTKGYRGLCASVHDAIYHYNKNIPSVFSIRDKISLFDKDIAIQQFNATDNGFWWPTYDWISRYNFMKWLIKQYK